MFLAQHVIFEGLRTWSYAAGLCALLLLIAGGIFLRLLLIGRQAKWQYAMLLLSVGVGIWALIQAILGLQEFVTLVENAPSHSLGGYPHAHELVYMANIQACQIVVVIACVTFVVLCLVACWPFSFLKRRDQSWAAQR
ncbi:MAG: hypothetical protein ABI456_23110 [Ktedonobacteraceae bacterium]|nr:hypothetical protein [Chloroflexota bacterium]